MDSAMIAEETSDKLDTPFIALETDGKRYVDEANCLVDNIKMSLAEFQKQQQLISSGAFTKANDLENAKLYHQQLDNHLDDLWRAMDEITTSVPKFFQNYLDFLRAECEGISNEKIPRSHEHNLTLMAVPHDKAQSCIQESNQLEEKFEQMKNQIIILQQQIEAYSKVIEQLTAMYSDCEERSSNSCIHLASAARILIDNTEQLFMSLLKRAKDTKNSVDHNAKRQGKYTKALMVWQFACGIDKRTSLVGRTDDASDRNGKVPWKDFFAALNHWFKLDVSENTSSIKITKGLEEHEEYMKHKRKSEPYKLTFWGWLYPVAEYISSKCAVLWENGFIAGFLSRQQAEQQLAASDAPSMLLKFSDSRPGKIVASFTDTNGVKHIMLDEDDTLIYADKSLIQRIKCLAKLRCVKKILPVGKSLDDLFQLESPSNSKLWGCYGCFAGPRVVVYLDEMPLPPPLYSSVHINDLNSPNNQNLDITSSTSPSNLPSYPDFGNPSEQSPASTSDRTA